MYLQTFFKFLVSSCGLCVDKFIVYSFLYHTICVVITQVFSANKQSLSQSAQLLQAWDLVSFPTETVYGLFADATNADAVRKIFFAKSRPADNPLIVHFADMEDVSQYAIIENDIQKLLIDRFMPGPFTIVLPKKNNIPDLTTWWLDTVCVRVPDHILARQIIREAWFPLAGPSANISWRPSPSSAQMVLSDMDTKIPLIIDGSRTLYGIESTVVKVEQGHNQHYLVKILRPWFVTKEDIESALPDDIKVSYTDEGVNESPWSRYRHYSPRASVLLFQHKTQKPLQDMLLDMGIDFDKSLSFIATKELLGHYSDELESLHNEYGCITMPLGSVSNLLECSQSLYQLYASCDKLWVEQIVIESFEEKGVGYSLMNRIRKSLS